MFSPPTTYTFLASLTSFFAFSLSESFFTRTIGAFIFLARGAAANASAKFVPDANTTTSLFPNSSAIFSEVSYLFVPAILLPKSLATLDLPPKVYRPFSP